MKIFKNIILFNLMIAFAFLTSCVKNAESIDTIKARENDEAIQAFLVKNNLTAIKTGSGVYYIITKKNDLGKSAVLGDLVSYHFKTARLDGFALDSTSRKNNIPAYTPMGTINNIWNQLASVLKVGERATFLLPYTFAYGSSDKPNIPAYSPIQMDFSIEKTQTEDEQITSYVADNKYKTTKTTTGLHYAITKAEPSGAELKVGQSIKVKYSGRLLYFTNILDANKKITPVFDSGEFEFVLGSGTTIKGFDEGIAKMRVGEKATLIFPSTLGYGDIGSQKDASGYQKILPKSPLSFDIEVVSAK
jgi:FKBP-type peptidyl-prolyl cis-trans isomerase